MHTEATSANIMNSPHYYIGVISAIMAQEQLLSKTPGNSADKDIVRTGLKMKREFFEEDFDFSTITTSMANLALHLSS